MRRIIGLSTAALLAVSACVIPIGAADSTIKGSGVTKVETRKVPDFRSVDVSASFEVTVTIGPRESVTLDVDDNLSSFVMTEVVAGVLMVRLAEGQTFQWANPQKLAIVVPSLESIAARGTSKIAAKVSAETKTLRVEADGAGSVRVTGLAFASIDVKARDVARVELSGRGKSLKINLAGASNLTTKETPVESAFVWMEGASRGEIRVMDSIEGALSGAASLTVDGQPKARRVKTSDASSVSYRKLDIKDMIKGGD